MNGIKETSPNEYVFVSYLIELNTLLNFAKQPANVEIQFKPEDVESDSSNNNNNNKKKNGRLNDPRKSL